MVYFIYDTIHDYVYEGSVYCTLDDTTVDAQNRIRKLEEYAKAIPYSSNTLTVPIIIKMPSSTLDVDYDDMLDFARNYVRGKISSPPKPIATSYDSVDSEIFACHTSGSNFIMAHLAIDKQSGEVVCDNCGKPINPVMATTPSDINYCYHCGAKFLNAIITAEEFNELTKNHKLNKKPKETKESE